MYYILHARPRTARPGKALSLLTASSAPDLFDQGQRRLERLLDAERAGVQEVGVRRLHQRRCAARAVALVAGEDVGQHRLLVGGLAPAAEFAGAALGADLGTSRDEDLHVGIGADHGADVAAVE